MDASCVYEQTEVRGFDFFRYLPRTKRSLKISESSAHETSPQGQRCDPSVKLNRFNWHKFLVFPDAVWIVNLSVAKVSFTSPWHHGGVFI